jgi:hypothetical protein
MLQWVAGSNSSSATYNPALKEPKMATLDTLLRNLFSAQASMYLDRHKDKDAEVLAKDKVGDALRELLLDYENNKAAYRQKFSIPENL